MKPPLFLLGLALLFWGWQTGLWLPALSMALVLESSSFLKPKLRLAENDFRHVADLCSLIVVALLFYAFLSQKSAGAFLLFLQWLPMGLFPLMAAQIFSSAGRIPLKTLFLLTRKTRPSSATGPDTFVNLSYPYFGVTVLSAGAANTGSPWFYWVLFLFTAWILRYFRSRRFSLLLWLVLLLIAGGIGYGGQLGLHRLQAVLEGKITAWYVAGLEGERDPYRTNTALGDVGTLKLSDRIQFRVALPPNGPAALLLREATFNNYQAGEWYAFRAGLSPLLPEKDGSSWRLAQEIPENGTALTVSMPLRNGKGLLKLPLRTTRIENLAVPLLFRNPYGALKVEEGPGLITYRARFNAAGSADSSPNEADLKIPDQEKDTVQAIIRDLGLAGLPPREKLNRLLNFFQAHFNYSLDLKAPRTKAAPIRDFLIRTRSGHCEYFASAAVFLLRAAGLPARYATGYSVQEYSKLEKQYVVRSRHAHAWTLVWYDGAWHEFDTTPPSWIRTEEESASRLQPLFDYWAWAVFRFTKTWGQYQERITGRFWWLLLPLLVWSAVKFRLLKRIGLRKKKKFKDGAEPVAPGLDSEFYLAERLLADQGLARHSPETPAAWLRRIAAVKPALCDFAKLEALLSLHYRYRFDPKGMTPEERLGLKNGTQAWLEKEKKKMLAQTQRPGKIVKH